MSNSHYPNLAALRQFVEIQEAGGIASAARNLGLTQPALSRNIKRLEELVGAPLLERHSRGAALTPAGNSLLKHASRVLLELEHGLESARKSAGISRKELRIGAGAVFSHAIIPSVLPAFEREFPDYKVTLVTISYEEIVDILIARKVDVCAHGIPIDRKNALRSRPVLNAKRSILCAANHPLAQATRPVSAADLADYPFVAFAPDRHQMHDLDRVFRDHGLNPPRIVLESDRLSSALHCLENGPYLIYGSALLAATAQNLDIVTIKTKFDLGSYEIGFTHCADYEMDSGAKRFLSIARSFLQNAA